MRSLWDRPVHGGSDHVQGIRGLKSANPPNKVAHSGCPQVLQVHGEPLGFR